MATPFQVRCRFVAVYAGAGNFVVASAYTSAFDTPQNLGAIDGKVYHYYAESPDGTVWEDGFGTWRRAAATLERTTVRSNSNNTTTVVTFASPPIVAIFPAAQPLETVPNPLPGPLVVAGDIYTYRADGNTSAIFLNSAGTRYLYWDGTNYTLEGGGVYASNGRLWGASDFNYTPLNIAGGTLTGLLTTAGSGNGLIQGSVGSNALWVQNSAASNHAFMTFLVSGYYGVNFGLASDGNLYYGGWSAGANAYRLWTTKDFASFPNPVVTMRMVYAADYTHAYGAGLVEPYAGAVVTGCGFYLASSATVVLRYRYLQMETAAGTWYTVPYA
jgi:hypothetical protein